MRPGRLLLAAVVCFVLIAAACGGSPQNASSPGPGPAITSSPPASTTAASQPSRTARPALDDRLRFTAKTVDGKDFDGASLAGRPAVLWFWAPWCPKCNAEAPGVAEIARTNAGRVTFVGVAARDQLPAMQQFVQRYRVDFAHIADNDAAVWTRFGVTEQPAYAFVASSGQIELVTRQLGKDELAAKVAALA